MPIVTIERDFDGYFERLVRTWYAQLLERGLTPKRKAVVINAGPYRSDAVQCIVSEDKETVHLEFYSGLRAGFGRLAPGEVNRIITEFL